MMITEKTPEQILDAIRRLDQRQWSQPSNSRALEIDNLEREYERLTGMPCPEWPKREN